MADRRADAADLVGGHARADTRAADEDPAIGLAADDRRAEPLGEVRVVVGRVRAVAAQVDPLVVEPGDRRAARSSSSLRAAPAWSAAKAMRIRPRRIRPSTAEGDAEAPGGGDECRMGQRQRFRGCLEGSRPPRLPNRVTLVQDASSADHHEQPTAPSSNRVRAIDWVVARCAGRHLRRPPAAVPRARPGRPGRPAAAPRDRRASRGRGGVRRRARGRGPSASGRGTPGSPRRWRRRAHAPGRGACTGRGCRGGWRPGGCAGRRAGGRTAAAPSGKTR